MKPNYKIIHEDIFGFNLLVVSCYPFFNEIHHFGYFKRDYICKDIFTIGVWKLKSLRK